MTSETNTTVFDKTNDEQVEVKETTLPIPQQDNPVFSGLVGEGRRYKTQEDLAKSKLEGDNFINQLKEEAKGLREDLDTRLRAEEAVEALKTSRDNANPEVTETALPDVGKIVRDTLTQVQSEELAERNIREANNYLVDKLGGKAEAEKYLEKKSLELEIPVKWFMDMAAKSPKALYNTLSVDAPVTPPPKGSIQGDTNTLAKENTNIEAATIGSKEGFDALRKSDPHKYWTPAVQNEIFKAQKEGRYN